MPNGQARYDPGPCGACELGRAPRERCCAEPVVDAAGQPSQPWFHAHGWLLALFLTAAVAGRPLVGRRPASLLSAGLTREADSLPPVAHICTPLGLRDGLSGSGSRRPGPAILPRIMGRTVELPAIVSLVAVLIGGVLLGIVGTLVAIPVVAAVRLLLHEIAIRRLDRS